MQELYREHQEIVHALRRQFHEYRATAESLFYSEARQLEDKLNAQVARYEEEIRFIVKSKDAHFNAMVTAKDAKVMNLIEGTDFQRVLVRHQMEVDAIKKQHERDAQLIREQVEHEQKKLVYQLKKQISTQQLELDKARSQMLQWEKKLEASHAALKKAKRAYAVKEESSEKHIREIQEQLRVSDQRCDKLAQEKEALRHKVLRLRFQTDGKEDGSLNAVVKRLQQESERLAHELAFTSIQLTAQTEGCQAALKRAERATAAAAVLEKELRARTASVRKEPSPSQPNRLGFIACSLSSTFVS